MTVVRVPASTANLGPGFDVLGMALTIYAEVGVADRGPGVDLSAVHVVDEHHPAAIAFARAGGRGRIWVRSPIPMGRGLGYSGAMRVGGAAAAVARAVDGDANAFAAGRAEIFGLAAELEGHADNVAASLYGGIVATDGSRTVEVMTPLQPDVIVWIPSSTTSTATSRTSLPDSVAFADAVFNIGRVALLLAALTSGDVDGLSAATQDRLHQHRRFAEAETSREALTTGLAAGAWCGWLSGSGPTVAMLAASGEGSRIAPALPPDGQVKVLAIDRTGATIVEG